MTRIVVDVENKFTVIAREGKTKKTDNMPYSGRNYLVSVGIEDIDTGTKKYWFFRHNDLDIAPEELRKRQAEVQAELDKATLICGHFLKHDVIWLRESGFKIARKTFWDTAICEYVQNRGQTHPLSLKELCIKYDLTRKKTDLTEKYLDEDIGFEAMPWKIVEEYGLGDITSTAELFRLQEKQLQHPDNIGLVPTVQMMNEFMYVLAKWQSNGIKIDTVELNKVRAEYVAEQKQLQYDLQNLARSVMGDTPFSLTSGIDKSVLIYSRRVKDRKEWVKAFNIGTGEDGKSLRRTRYKDGEFVSKVRELTEVEYRTSAAQCMECTGTGKVARVLKNGTMGKPRFVCKGCDGCGIVYTKTGKVAGFKFKPKNYKSTTANGFDTDKSTIEELAKTAPEGDGKLFLEKLKRLNAVNVYISTFCDGILNNITRDNVLYTNFNQCITATARLSSTDPNFQNQPRGKTFPVRRAIVSRFPGGTILEGDFAQLEFRVAGELSGDKQVLEDLLNKVDVHAFTRDTLNAAGMPVDRQGAKSHCVPLTTKILTPTGWKAYNEVSVGDEVINYDPATKTLVTDSIIDYTPPHQQEVIRMSTSHNWHVDSTAGHRWYCEKRVDRGSNGRKYEPCVVTTENVHSEHRIITSAFSTHTAYPCDIPEMDAVRLAWLWTDGSECNGNNVIIQKNYNDTVRSIFAGCFTKEYEQPNGCTVWRLPVKFVRDMYTRCGITGKKDAVQFVLRMDHEVRRKWLAAVIIAEGTLRKHGEVRIAQNSGELCEAIKLAGFLSGFDIRVVKVISRTGKQHEQITLRTRPYVTGQRIHKTSLGEQQVWCVSTNNGTMVIKNSETIQVSGNSFKPLYGGEYGTPAEMTYYKAFKQKYRGVAEWQQRISEIVLRRKVLTLPSGREYCWPRAERKWNGQVDFFTQIVNYPVQGFATADIVPLACIILDRRVEAAGLRSVPFLTVHDSIALDVWPGEEDQVALLLAQAMLDAKQEMLVRYSYDFKMPLEVEVKSGVNWLDTKVVLTKAHTYEVAKTKNDDFNQPLPDFMVA